MRRRYQSYLVRSEEKQNIRRAFILLLMSLGLIVILFFFGIPSIVRFASLLGNIKNSTQPVDSSDSTPPISPRIDTLPEAINSQKLEIKGSSEPGSTVIITLNGNDTEVLTNNEGEFSLIANLMDGENNIEAISQDSAGNKSQTSDLVVVIFDKTPPSLEINTPQDGSQYYGSKQRLVVIEGTSEKDAQVRINDRFVLLNNDGKFTYTTTLNEGENKFLIKSSDKAGNVTEKNLTLSFAP